MPSTTEEIEEIRRQMARLRITLHHDMRGVVAGAEAATDWRFYVRQYPWLSLATAALGGFLIVPRRRRSITATANAAATAAVERVKRSEPELALREDKKSRRGGLIGFALSLLGPIALRAAQGYAVQYIENLLARQDTGGPSDTDLDQSAQRTGGSRRGFTG